MDERDVTQKDVKCLSGFGILKKFGNNKLNVDIFMKSSLGWYVSPRPDNWKAEKQKNMDVTSLGNMHK